MPAGAVAVAAIGLVWAGLLLAAPSGFFVVDEVIIWAATDAIAGSGSLTVDNGLAFHQSEDLRIQNLLRVGPKGLVPLYPSGYAILGAPLLLAFGLKGPMTLCVASAVLLLVVCRLIARRLSGGDERVAAVAVLLLGVASFLPDYAVTLLPHAPAALAVAISTLLAIRIAEGTGRPRRDAALIGLAISAGLLFRLDPIIALGPIGLWLLFRTEGPHRLALPALLGLLPGLAFLSVTNAIKFGTFNPLSYGATGGGDTTLSTYSALILAGVGAAAVALGARLLIGRPRALAALLGAAGAAAALVLGTVPEAGGLVRRILHGLTVLFVDLRMTQEIRQGIVFLEDGGVLFWGLAKKALGQSMPWIAMTVVLMRAPASPSRPGIGLLGLCILLWALPFALNSWHGGYASNLRYFTPVLPHLAILGALALTRIDRWLGADAPEAGMRRAGLALPAASAVLGAGLGMLVFGTGALGTLQAIVLQHHSTVLIFTVLLGLGALVLLAGPVPGVLRVIRGTASVAVALAAAIGWGADLGHNLDRRAVMATMEARLAPRIPERSLVYVEIAEPFTFLLRRDGSFLAMGGRFNDRVDAALIKAALDAGMTVFVQPPEVRRLLKESHPDLVEGREIQAETYPPLVEIRADGR